MQTMSATDRALLVRVLATQSTSGETTALRERIREECAAIGATVEEDHAGNLYAPKGMADVYPCLVAHTDTVHDIIPASDFRVYLDPEPDEYWAENHATGLATGIGGDDKAGVYVALAMLRDLPAGKAFFPVDEEIGCHGSRAADLAWFADCSLVIQADRSGIGEVVGEISGVELMGDALRAALAPYRADHGVRHVSGALTDVLTLKRRGLSVGAMNVACGYYRPHSSYEYVSVPDLARAHTFIREIVAALGERPWAHTYQPAEDWDAYGAYSYWLRDDPPAEKAFDCGLPGCGTASATCHLCDGETRTIRVYDPCAICGRYGGDLDAWEVCGRCRARYPELGALLADTTLPHRPFDPDARRRVRCRFCGARGAPSLDYDSFEGDWYCWSCSSYQGQRAARREDFERRARWKVTQ